MCYCSPQVHGPATSAGVWLRALELEIGVTLWAICSGRTLHVSFSQGKSKCPSRVMLPVGRRWSLILWPSARHQPKLQDHVRGVSVWHGVPVYASTTLCCWQSNPGPFNHESNAEACIWMLPINRLWKYTLSHHDIAILAEVILSVVQAQTRHSDIKCLHGTAPS